jgi:transcriptional regulator with XRE-family HTH domain
MQVRKFFKLSQIDFGSKLNLTNSTISYIESNKRNVTDRIIFDICREFNVNKNWLRTGEGEMLSPEIDENDFYFKLGYYSNNLTEFQKNIIIGFLEMPEQTQNDLMDLMKKLVNKQSNNKNPNV